MKKTILILLLASLICTFAACGTTAENAGETTAATETEEAIILNADFGGYEFKVLTSGCGGNYNDFDFEEDSSKPLDRAQYARKKKVESDFNINIIETAISSGNTSGSGEGYRQIATAVSSGTCTYDLALIGGYDVTTLAYNGLLYDMNAIPSLDLTNSWWDQNANESLGINGSVFYTAGEISPSRADAAFCILFNKKIANDYDIENPYDMVKNGTWTIENFASLCKQVTEDLNSDGIMNGEDRYGLLVLDDSIVGIINAAGERCCETDENGKITLTIYNDTTVSALDKFFNIALDTQYALSYQRIQSGREYEDYLWTGDHGLFWTSYMKMVPRYRDMESDFGILPYPKFSETQDDYYSTIFPYISQFICIPAIQNDTARTAVITEALGYYGEQIVKPAYYDVSLKGQAARDAESLEMLDIIFGNLVYDVGYYHQIGPYNKQLIYMMREGDSSFTTRYETYRTAAETQINQINNAYDAVTKMWSK